MESACEKEGPHEETRCKQTEVLLQSSILYVCLLGRSMNVVKFKKE